MQPDTVVPDPGNPQALNRYAYVLNNPLKYADLSGHVFGNDDVLIGVLIGAVIGGVAGGIQGGAKGALLGALNGSIGGLAVGAGVLAGASIGAAMSGASGVAAMSTAEAMIGGYFFQALSRGWRRGDRGLPAELARVLGETPAQIPGRRRCPARKPDCAHCEIARLCPSASVDPEA